MRRLWFLAVLFCLWAFSAQAVTRTPFSFVPEQSPKPSFSPRLEQAVPHQNSPSLLVAVRVWPDGRIGIFVGGDPENYLDPDGRIGKEQLHNLNAAGGWLVDTVVNMGVGSAYLLHEGAYLGLGDPESGAAAQRELEEMSPYAKQGYYNPNTPTAKLASMSTMLIAPESLPGRLGTLESTVTRTVTTAVTTTTRETVQTSEMTAIQNGVNNSTPLLTAPAQPVALLPENAASLTAKPLGPPSLMTSPNQAYFWSGLGRNGASTAATIANRAGGTTLETMIESSGLQMPVWDAANPASVAAWRSASAVFAQGASGEVRVILGNSLRPGNIWETVEMPALEANQNVTSVIQVNPSTGEETVLFHR